MPPVSAESESDGGYSAEDAALPVERRLDAPTSRAGTSGSRPATRGGVLTWASPRVVSNESMSHSLVSRYEPGSGGGSRAEARPGTAGSWRSDPQARVIQSSTEPESRSTVNGAQSTSRTPERPRTGGSRPGTAGKRPGTAGSAVEELLEFSDGDVDDLPFESSHSPLPPAAASSPIEKLDKKQTLAQIRSLGIRAAALERDALSRLVSRRAGGVEYDQLQQTAKDLEKERDAERKKLGMVLDKIQADASRFKQMLQNVSSAPSFVQRVQRLMEGIEAAILKLKEEQQETYNKLLAKERLVEREVSAYAARFEAWKLNPEATAARRVGGRAGTGSSKVSDGPAGAGRSVPPEVKELEQFVANSGGLTGGWSEYDHGVFLRERLRHRSPAAAVTATSAKLVGHTEFEVRQHEAWYARYLELVAKKKAAIAQWRAAKRQAQEEEQKGSHHEAEVKKKLQQERKAAAAAAAEAERKQKAEDVARWKAEKEARRREAEAEKRATMQAEAEERRAAEKERRRRQRAQVQSFAEQRAAEEERRKKEAEAQAVEQARRAPTAAELAYFRARDEAAYQEQLEQRHAAAQAALEKAERLERMKRKVRVEAPRDPSRLTRPTASSRARELDLSKSGGQVIARAPPKLTATPSWRKGM